MRRVKESRAWRLGTPQNGISLCKFENGGTSAERKCRFVRTDVQAKTEGNRLKSTTCGPRECDAQQVVRPDGALYTCIMDR